MTTKCLFIIKKRVLPQYGDLISSSFSPANPLVPNQPTISSGLVNSAKFVSDMLNEHGQTKIHSKVVQVIDNNCIDREVTAFKPDLVFIEALWVVPEKFKILHKLHPKVKWVIRVHSETPFMANEGMSMEWLFQYSVLPNVFISSNSERVNKEIECMTLTQSILLPNYYPLDEELDYSNNCRKDDGTIDISCFGAIRPLKNQLLQAMAAIAFADSIGKTLNFHINVNRLEDNGDPVLKNIRGLFAGRKDHNLVQHLWKNHEDFIELVKQMDIGMQASFTETFNIVSADHVAQGVPIVVSKEISWSSKISHVDPTSFSSIVEGLERVWAMRLEQAQELNTRGLKKYNQWSKRLWLDYVLDNES